MKNPFDLTTHSLVITHDGGGMGHVYHVPDEWLKHPYIQKHGLQALYENDDPTAMELMLQLYQFPTVQIGSIHMT